MSHITKNIYPITRGSNNPLHVLRDSNDNNQIFAIGNPHGDEVINAFANEGKALTKNPEQNIALEEDLDKIDPKHLYKGGIAHKKRSKKRHTSRKTKKRRSSKKRKSRRSNKKKSK